MSESFAFRLRDPNPEMRERALMELVFAPDVNQLEHMLKNATDKDRDVRRTTMLALGALNVPEVLPGLLEGLLDDDNDVVIAAEHALSKLGEKAEQHLYEWLFASDWLKRRAALQALKHFEVVAERVIPFVHDEVWEVRYGAYVLLASIPSDDSLKVLLRSADQEDHPQARDGILYALGKIQRPEARDVLLQRFFDPQDIDNTDILAQSIEDYGTEVVEPLKKWGLWSPYPHVRALSAALLSQMEVEDLLPEFRALLYDSTLEVRETVAYALYQYTTEPIWELLAGLYQDADGIFAEALKAITELPLPGVEEKTTLLLQVFDQNQLPARSLLLIQALEKMDARGATQAFIEKLRITPSLKESENLIRALGHFKARAAIPDLLTLFEEPALENPVATALVQIAPEQDFWQDFLDRQSLSPQALLSLYTTLSTRRPCRAFLIREALKGFSLTSRVRALQVLVPHQRRFEDFRTAEFLKDYLKQHPEPEEQTLDALIHLSEAVDILPDTAFATSSQWLSSPYENLRRGGVYFLRPHRLQFQTQLLELLEHELWFVRHSVLEILGPEAHPEVIAAIRAGLTDRDRDVRVLAVALVGQLQVPERLDWLVDTLENGYREIRAVAARALGRFENHKVVLEPLEMALVEDEAAEVRQAAIETLTRLEAPDLQALIEEALDYEDDPEVWLAGIQSLVKQHAQAAHQRALTFLESPLELKYLRQLIQLFGEQTWPLEPLQAAIKHHTPELQTQLERQLLPFLCAQRPDMARQALYHDEARTVAAVIQHLPEEMLQAEKIWIKALWKQKDPYIRRAIYARWSRSEALWDEFVALARQEEDLSLRQTLIEKLEGMPLDRMLPLCESLFVKHTAHTQSPLVWSLASHLQTRLSHEELQRVFQVFVRSQDSIRQQVFEMLAATRGPQVLPLLDLALESWDQDLVNQSVVILPLFEGEGLERLLKIWPEAPLATRSVLLNTLLRFEKDFAESARLLPLLEEALWIPQLQAQALAAFVHFGRDFAFDTLIKHLSDSPEQRSLRYAIAHALVQLSEDPLWKRMRGVNSQLPMRRQRALIQLKKALREADPDIPWYACLIHLHEDEAYGVRSRFYELNLPPQHRWHNILTRGLRYDKLPVQLVCVTQLEMIFDERVKEELLSFWPEARFMLKESILSVLANHGMPGMSLECITDIDSKVRISAACLSGLHRMVHAEPLLIERVWNDPSDAVRGSCCWSLGQLGTDAARDTLYEVVAQNHFALRYQALRALGNIEAAGDYLTTCLKTFQQDRELLFVTLQSLKQLRHAPAVPLVIDMLENTRDEELKTRCLSMLKAVKSSQSKQYLMSRLRGGLS